MNPDEMTEAISDLKMSVSSLENRMATVELATEKLPDLHREFLEFKTVMDTRHDMTEKYRKERERMEGLAVDKKRFNIGRKDIYIGILITWAIGGDLVAKVPAVIEKIGIFLQGGA